MHHGKMPEVIKTADGRNYCTMCGYLDEKSVEKEITNGHNPSCIRYRSLSDENQSWTFTEDDEIPTYVRDPFGQYVNTIPLTPGNEDSVAPLTVGQNDVVPLTPSKGVAPLTWDKARFNNE